MKPPALLLLLLTFLSLAACGREAPAGRPPAAGAPPAALASLPGGGIELRRGLEPRELVRIGVRGVVIGTEGGRLEWKLFADSRRAAQAWSYLQVYAPFELRSTEGDLRFHGHGTVSPGPTERRMILEWARRVAAEAAGVRVGDAYGLVLGWHQGGSAGLCEDVALYLTGEAVATACGWNGEVRGRLDPAPLGRVYDWYDRLQAFQTGGSEPEEDLGPGKLPVRVLFAGRGATAANAEERDEIQSLAAAIFAELAARRRGSAATAAAAPSSPHLLLPPQADRGAAEIVLQLPDQPPLAPSPLGDMPIQRPSANPQLPFVM